MLGILDHAHGKGIGKIIMDIPDMVVIKTSVFFHMELPSSKQIYL